METLAWMAAMLCPCEAEEATCDAFPCPADEEEAT